MKPSDTKTKREIAIILRKKGQMYSEIARDLDVPKSTVYSWLKTIKLTPAEKSRTEKRLKLMKSRAAPRLVRAKQAKANMVDSELNAEAENICKDFASSRSNQVALLSMLFWGEGEKNVSGGMRFINSDPEMVSFYVRLFRSCFDLDESKIRVMLHIHEYHDPELQVEYWSKKMNIPDACFYKPYVKPNTGKQRKENYQGTVSFRYMDYRLGKLLKMIYTRLSQNIGV